MIWLILLFLTYVRADDDSLDFGEPRLPPRKNAKVLEQMSNELKAALRASFGGSATTGSFRYPPMSDLISEYSSQMNECYENGMGAPKIYLFEETIWDIKSMKAITIPKNYIYCSMKPIHV